MMKVLRLLLLALVVLCDGAIFDDKGHCKKSKPCIGSVEHSLLALGEDKVTALFNRVDTDGDGEISKKESKSFRRNVLKGGSFKEYLAKTATA
uniref:EF-hand domain-containing protein n=1 Tax=Aureoumbra lagunensis TaxID=44058 RepID=A0A7S3JVP3_9STRA|mmetsp:Transcript_1280/g.1621  ORF Transcript_1280/g.1621 Transcript_1280/m.1621 type:complete len:93 (+) Transcript_1280:39-317(+)